MIKAIGIDIVGIDKIKSVWRNHHCRLQEVMFTVRELQDIRYPAGFHIIKYPALTGKQARILAAKFAAKEATIKALNLPYNAEYELSDIEVLGCNCFIINLGDSLKPFAVCNNIIRLLGCSCATNEVGMALVLGVFNEQ